MVKVLPPLRPEYPTPAPGMAFSVAPSPHIIWLDDYEYYDQLGRDPMQRNKLWLLETAEDRLAKFKELLEEYPKQCHRRRMMSTMASRGEEHLLRVLLDAGTKVEIDMDKAKVEAQKAKDGEIDYGGDGNIPDRENPTVAPLHVAASRGQLGCVKIMIEEAKVSVDLRNHIGQTPIYAGAREYEIVRYLLGQGANPTLCGDPDSEVAKKYGNYTTLELAVAADNFQGVKLLLDHPIYGSKRPRQDHGDHEAGVFVTPTCIKWAAATKNSEMLKTLLHRGGYPRPDKSGETRMNDEQRKALHEAIPSATNGSLDNLKLLLSYEYPSDPDGDLLPFEVPEDWHKDFTYGVYNAAVSNSIEKFEWIKKFDVREHDTMSLDQLPDGQNVNIQNLFDRACRSGSVDMAKHLIENYGAEPDKLRVPPGMQPITIAAMYGQADMVKYLLDNHPIDLHRGSGRHSAGPTALWTAILLKRYETIELLLKHGGPVDYIDPQIREINDSMKVMLRKEPTEDHISTVRLELVDNSYTEMKQKDWMAINAHYVFLELEPTDNEWIDKLEIRREREKLRDGGSNPRELDPNEEEKNLPKGDIRTLMPPLPTVEEREWELNEDMDLAPHWRPLWAPAQD